MILGPFAKESIRSRIQMRFSKRQVACTEMFKTGHRTVAKGSLWGKVLVNVSENKLTRRAESVTQ